jgi:hypothetical protein
MQPNELQRAGQRAVEWAAGLLEKDGSFKGCPGVILAYYKAPVAFSLAGRGPDAGLLVRYIGSTFFKDGDFNGAANDLTATGGANYRNAWLTWGTQLFGALKYSFAAGDLLERMQNGASGGVAFREMPSEAEREVDWGSSCAAVIGLLALGRRDAAVRAGRFLQWMIVDQPKPGERLFLRRSWPGELLGESKQVDKANCILEIGAPGQIYWYLGIALVAFGRLHMATGDSSWMDSADEVLGWINRCNEDVYASITNAKVAWGAGTIYGISRDPRYGQLCERIAGWLLSVQTPEGVWLRRPMFSTVEEQPLAVSLDTSLERAVYMFELAKVFSMASA